MSMSTIVTSFILAKSFIDPIGRTSIKCSPFCKVIRTVYFCYIIFVVSIVIHAVIRFLPITNNPKYQLIIIIINNSPPSPLMSN